MTFHDLAPRLHPVRIPVDLLARALTEKLADVGGERDELASLEADGKTLAVGDARVDAELD